MKEQEFQNQVIRYLTGELSVEERYHLLESLQVSAERQKFFEEYREIWEKTNQPLSIPSTSVDEQWRKFEDRAFAPSEKTIRVVPLWAKPLFKIAAMIAILAMSVMTWSLFINDSALMEELLVIQTAGEVREMILPDSSKIWLDKNSRIEYLSDFHPRYLRLEGQALFQVQHVDEEHTFIVQAGETKTTVLGTVFLVRSVSEDEQVTVYVQEGKVAFESEVQSGNREVVIAGEQIVYDREEQSVTRQAAMDVNILSWKTGVFSFADAALSVILPTLEQYYQVKFLIMNQALLDCSYRTDFTNMNLEEMLDELSFGLNLQIRKVGDGLFEVEGTSCK